MRTGLPLRMPVRVQMQAAGLYALQVGDGAFVHDVAGVERGGGFEEEEPAFLIGYGFVFDAARNDDEFAFFDPFVVVAVFHTKAAFDDEEQFVFMFVMMEDEFALDLVEFDVLAVEFGRDVGLPVFRDLGEFFGDIDLGHE